MDKKLIYTVGHSNRTLEEFIELLKSYKIRRLIDIRRFPGSRKYPHFNQEELRVSLGDVDIHYCHVVELGGRRQPLANSHNTAWRNKSFQGYADHMEHAEFSAGISKLLQNAEAELTAYMCSEATWWNCHRALVSDYLKINGWHVMHILTKDKSIEHPYTSPAKIVQGKLFYD